MQKKILDFSVCDVAGASAHGIAIECALVTMQTTARLMNANTHNCW